MIPTDEQALDLFAELREMSFAHKSERGNRACDLRAHKAWEILAERGIDGLAKIWRHSLPEPDGTIGKNIRAPVEPVFKIGADDYNEAGQPKYPEHEEPKPYNIHTALLVPTTSGRQLVFDVYFYDAPPDLEQWLEDFQPFEPGTGLGCKITEPDYVYFAEIEASLPPPGTLRRLWRNTKDSVAVNFELKYMQSNPLDHPLPARWIFESPSEPDVPQDAEPDEGIPAEPR